MTCRFKISSTRALPPPRPPDGRGCGDDRAPLNAAAEGRGLADARRPFLVGRGATNQSGPVRAPAMAAPGIRRRPASPLALGAPGPSGEPLRRGRPSRCPHLTPVANDVIRRRWLSGGLGDRSPVPLHPCRTPRLDGAERAAPSRDDVPRAARRGSGIQRISPPPPGAGQRAPRCRASPARSGTWRPIAGTAPRRSRRWRSPARVGYRADGPHVAHPRHRPRRAGPVIRGAAPRSRDARPTGVSRPGPWFARSPRSRTPSSCAAVSISHSRSPIEPVSPWQRSRRRRAGPRRPSARFSPTPTRSRGMRRPSSSRSRQVARMR